MRKSGLKKLLNGAHASKSAKRQLCRSHRNGHVHVISPATASEIARAVGVKRSHIANVLRAFSEAGIKV